MDRNKIRQAFFGFIPHHVPNRTVLWFYGLFSRRRGRPGRLSRFDGDGEKTQFRRLRMQRPSPIPMEHPEAPYIEDQARRTDERYGASTVARAGCEVIAVYNALLCLCGCEVYSLRELLDLFQKRGMVFRGLWGTSPRAPLAYFEAWGFDAVYVTEPERFNEIAQGFPCAIMSYYNDGQDIRRGVHTICLTKETAGWVAHNLTEDGKTRGPFSHADSFLNAVCGGRARGLCLICIRNRV